MRHDPRLIVRPDLTDIFTRSVGCSMALLLVFGALYPELGPAGSSVICLLPFSLWIGYTILRCRNWRVFVFDWGMVFCGVLGTVKKVTHSDLTSVRISPGRRYVTTVEFYSGRDYVASCCSRDENYALLMKVLSEKIPEKLDWASGSCSSG